MIDMLGGQSGSRVVHFKPHILRKKGGAGVFVNVPKDTT